MQAGADPGTVLCHRHGAICLSTVDGAVWVGRARHTKSGKFPFKLPTTMVLGDAIKKHNIPEHLDNPFATYPGHTFRDIWYEDEGDVGILNFNFHNGAMDKGGTV